MTLDGSTCGEFEETSEIDGKGMRKNGETGLGSQVGVGPCFHGVRTGKVKCDTFVVLGQVGKQACNNSGGFIFFHSYVSVAHTELCACFSPANTQKLI